MRYLFYCSIGLLFVGCAHTNKLRDNDLRSQHIAMRVIAATSGNASSDISTDSMNLLAGIAATVGGSAVASQTQEKLNRATNPESLANAAARGFHSALATYLDVTPSGENAKENYIAETKLTEYSLHSSKEGAFAHVAALSRILKRESGEVVWAYGTEKNVTLSSGVTGSAVANTASSIVNASTLAQMSERDMATIFQRAAERVGQDIGEVLREDVEELHKK